MDTPYYSPGSCSIIIHSLLEELAVRFETPDGPLTECVALIAYLCDRRDDGRLLGQHGSWERAKTIEPA